MTIHGVLGSSIVTILFFASPLTAQVDIQWWKTFGGGNDDLARSVAITRDSGYIVLGCSWNSGADGWNFYLVRTDSTGDSLWTNTYGGANVDMGYSVAPIDSGFVLCGYTYSYGAGLSDGYLIKTDEDGNQDWNRTYGGADFDWTYSVDVVDEGGYILTGYTQSFGAGNGDLYLLRVNQNGDTIWTRTFGGAEHDEGWYVEETSDEGFICVGVTLSMGDQNGDVFLVKTDASGNMIWQENYGGPGFDIGYCAKETMDGGFIVVGATESFGSGGRDIYVIKTDSMGDTMWTRSFGDSLDDIGHSLQESDDSSFIVVGSTILPGQGESDLLIMRVSSSGDSTWAITFGGSGEECAYSVKETPEKEYILCGFTTSYGEGGKDVLLLKTTQEVRIVERSVATRETKIYTPNPAIGKNVPFYFELSRPSKVELRVFDCRGRLVYPEISRFLGRGSHMLYWGPAKSGKYYYLLRAGDETFRGGFVLLP